MKLIDKNNFVHGVADSVSELTQFYYAYRKQHGYMEVIDNNNNVLATLGSK
jgi:hypothetical protein